MSLVVLLCSASAQTPSTNSTANCEREIQEKIEKLKDQYAEDLDKLRHKSQSQGNLENALVLKTESDRFGSDRKLTVQDIVKSPKELSDLQSKYVALQVEASRQVANSWIEKLEQAKRELTNAGKLDDARLVQKEIDDRINS